MNTVIFFDKLNKTSFYLLLFLIPVFFLPFTQNVLDLPKQTLALILIFLSLIGWLAKKIFEGRFELRQNKIFYLTTSLILVLFLISSIFSLWPKISFFGYSLDSGESFVVFLSLFALTFLIINSFKTEIEFIPFLFFLLLSGAIAGIINLLQIYKIFILPFDFANNSSFNTIGTTNSLAIFMAILLPISLILVLRSKGFFKVILGLISLILFTNVILVNSKTAWLSLIVGILTLFIFGSIKEKEIKISFTVILMIGLVLSLFFYFFPISLPGFPSLAPEVSLNLNSEIYILKGVFSGGIKNIILGSGPGTFIFDYSRYHPSTLNQTIFWGTRFTNGQSSFLDWFLTKGILSGLALLFFYCSIIYFIFKNLGRTDNKDFFEIKLGLSASILSLIFASLLYAFNFTLYFSLFFLVGGFFLFFSPKPKEINLLSRSRIILANSFLMATIIAVLSLFFVQGQRYLAEATYLRGMDAFKAGNVELAIENVQSAAKSKQSIDIYWRDLSQLYLSKSKLIFQDPAMSLEEKTKEVNLAIVSGAEAIDQAIKTAPINVANWNVRGFFYRNLIGIERAGEVALDSYKKAIQLEPASPFAYGEIGRVYILMAQDAAQKDKQDLAKQDLDLAEQSLKEAINLKPDYAPANYLLAVVYDQQGKADEAISKLEEMQTINAEDSGVAFQLGLLYWRKEMTDDAQEQFEKAIILDSNYSDARYMLGLVYDKEGDKEKAKNEFEKLFAQNPGDEQLKKILENLRAGLPALEGISSPQMPLPEVPSEIKNSQP